MPNYITPNRKPTVATRECPDCKKTLEYTRKYICENAQKENKSCYDCRMKKKAGTKKDWVRNCPSCGELQQYSNKGAMAEANKYNKTCLNCVAKERMTRKDTDFSKKCFTCDTIIFYKNKISLDDAVERNSKCKPCTGKEASIRQTGLGNKGLMLLKYGETEGIKKWEEAEKKRVESFHKYWVEHPDEYDKLIARRETFGSKFFNIAGLRCQGNSEKYYIEKLIENNIELPLKGKGILTPIGYYFPDFEYPDRYVEIKSSYTYTVLKKKDNTQYLKMKWVANNIKPIEIISVDDRKKILESLETLNCLLSTL